MDSTTIKAEIGNILGANLSPVGATKVTDDTGIFECAAADDSYVFAMLGSSVSTQPGSGKIRKYAQMQGSFKPKVINAYEDSKKSHKKFFIIVPDSTNFHSDNYYVFVELMEKGASSSSNFTINIPTSGVMDRIIRDTKTGVTNNATMYYVTYVPAKDTAGNHTDSYLKQYLYAFDSRPFSKYLVKISDFLPSPYASSDVVKTVSKDTWPVNFLISGAPGTGKSFMLTQKADEAVMRNIFASQEGSNVPYDAVKLKTIIGEMALDLGMSDVDCHNMIIRERVRRITFYDDYTYESFIGCYKPQPITKDESTSYEVVNVDNSSLKYKIDGKTIGKQIDYTYEPGPFINTYVDAKKHPNNIYFILIEEINRAKAASVFGDMFQLLDRKDGVSEYSITPEAALDSYLRRTIEDYDGTMRLPENMYVWATMNNADQGVYPLDSAFKRRWGYLYLDVDSSFKEADLSISHSDSVSWNIFRQSLNEKILLRFTEDKCIGAWYFKDEELNQIKEYYEETDISRKRSMLNPLSDKLLIYLLNDVSRLDPDFLFNTDYQSMPAIRRALLNNVSLKDILNIDWKIIDEKMVTIRKSIFQGEDTEEVGGDNNTVEADSEDAGEDTNLIVVDSEEGDEPDNES